MARRINPRDLGREISAQLNIYTSRLSGKTDKAALKVAKDLVSDLKATSPKGDTGEYAKGWKYTKKGSFYTIHNAKRYYLTHLLEKGHAKRNGGRVNGTVHIKPAEQKAIRAFEEAVKKAVEDSCL